MVERARAEIRAGRVALLEREAALAELSGLIGAARDGRGSFAVVVGDPGEGKTALVSEALRLGVHSGLRVSRARGIALEQQFAFGVARQLLAGPVMELDPDGRSALRAGAARLGMGVLGLDEGFGPLDQFAAQHGLYWLLAGLSGRGPLMLLVDDAHWADEPSLAWLASLLPSIGELSVLVVVATRPVAFDGAGNALAELLGAPQIPLLRVGPLGRQSIATLVRAELDAEPDELFVDACQRMTAGNPLALVELVRDLRRAGGAPDAVRAALLGERVPEAFGRHVLGRLDRLGPEAVEVAQVLAVLGDRAELRQVAPLAGVGVERAGVLIDELMAAGIVARASGMRFDHPLVEAAIRDAMTERQLAKLHARAATLLAEEQSSPESIAAHLMFALPVGDPQRVAVLRAAAVGSLQRGSPNAAVGYLERALAEPPPFELRSVLLGELGGAAWAAGDIAAIGHLQAARELASNDRERTRLDLMLAEMCFYAGQYDRTTAVLDLALADLAGREPALEFELRAMRATLLATARSSWPAAADAEHEQLAALIGPGSDIGRQLQLTLAAVGIWTGRHSAAATVTRVEASLDESMLTLVDGGSLMRVGQGLAALIFADRPERAIDLANGMAAHAAAHGLALKLAYAFYTRALAELRQGALADAEASARASLEITSRLGARFAETFTRATLAETLLGRGRIHEAAQVLEELPDGVDAPSASLFTHAARARLYQAREQREAAVTELMALGEETRRNEINNPGFLPWRSQLVHLLAAVEPGRALELAERELTDARRVSMPSAIGVALRARAACEHDAAREVTLREAVAELEQSPVRLELTRALIDLGAHLRRSGRRRDARDPLRQALELAHRCAAEPLVALATDELHAADGRPRSPWLTGAAALTPSELRVARLAASGLTNQQVAQALFITLKTVEMHLTNTYRKLDCNSRADLTRLLGTERPGN